MRSLISFVFLLGVGVAGLAQENVTRISGEVFRGQSYRAEIGYGLYFSLEPMEEGWVIAIHPLAHCAASDGYAMVVNPPYRNYNQLWVAAAYGNTASEAVHDFNPREFFFVLTCQDYKLEGHRLDIVLWPGNYSQQVGDLARKELGTSPLGKGTFTILKSRVSRAEKDVEGKNYGKIDWLMFRLEVTFPAGVGRKGP